MLRRWSPSVTRSASRCAMPCAGVSDSTQLSSAAMRCARWRSWCVWNTTSTETPYSSRCSRMLAAARWQAASSARRARTSCVSWRSSPDSACSRTASAARASCRNGSSRSSSALMRWRSGPENPDARIALARYMMASRKGPRQLPRVGAAPACHASCARAPRRASVVVVDRLQPLRVVGPAEQQAEQRRKIGRLGRRRQHAAAQALPRARRRDRRAA